MINYMQQTDLEVLTPPFLSHSICMHHTEEREDNMTETQIIDTYAKRKMTIREIAKASGRSYANVRKVLTGAGYHFSKKI